jgi:hypothetical protein
LSITALSHAQAKVSISMPAEGKRLVWIGSSYPQKAPEDAEEYNAKSFEITVPAKPSGDRLFIWDHASGNIADKPLKDIRGSWNLAAGDFRRAGRVRIKLLSSEGKPVAAALVVVTGKDFKREFVLASKQEGVVELFAVPFGELHIVAKLGGLDGAAHTVTQDNQLSLRRDEADATFIVGVPFDVETVGPAKVQPPKDAEEGEEGSAPPRKRSDDETRSPLGTLVSIVLTLAIAGGIVYGILLYLRNNKDTVQAKLSDLGVVAPQPQADDTAATVTPIAAPQPPQQILLDDAAPTPIGAALDPYVEVASAMVGAPRISGSAGSFDLPEGLYIVGREEDLPIALPNESSVSRRHAEIVSSGGVVTVRDLGSTNGTYINAKKVEDEATLKNGDVVQFGAVRFRYEA